MMFISSLPQCVNNDDVKSLEYRETQKKISCLSSLSGIMSLNDDDQLRHHSWSNKAAQDWYCHQTLHLNYTILYTANFLLQVTPKPKTYVILISSCSCLCPIHWSQVLSWEWRCSWSSADRRCSNYIWVISNFIAYSGVTYIRCLTVVLHFK